MYLCLCKGITESDVCKLGRSGVVSTAALAAQLGIDQQECCGRCLQSVADLAALAQAERIRTTLKARAGTFTPS